MVTVRALLECQGFCNKMQCYLEMWSLAPPWYWYMVTCRHWQKALELILASDAENVQPNLVANFCGCTKCTCHCGSVEQRKCAHEHIIESGSCDWDVFLRSILVFIYAKCGRMADDVWRVFNKMPSQKMWLVGML